MNEKVFQRPQDRATLALSCPDTDYYAQLPRERAEVLVLNPPRPSECGALVATPQTGLAQIAALLDAAGYAVDVIDAPGLGIGWEALERRIRARRPRYLVVQATTATLTNDLRAALIGKAAGSVTLASGAHVTPLSCETLAAYPALDIVVRGEPELTILDVLQTLDRDAGSDRPALTERYADDTPTLIAHALCGMHGITYRDKQMRARINPDRAPIENLDSLPTYPTPRAPALAQLPATAQRRAVCLRPHQPRLPCQLPLLSEVHQRAGRLRHRSVEHVLQELVAIEALGIRYVHFDADLFTVKKEFIYDLCRAIIKQRLRLRWSCSSRGDSVDEVELG